MSEKLPDEARMAFLFLGGIFVTFITCFYFYAEELTSSSDWAFGIGLIMASAGLMGWPARFWWRQKLKIFSAIHGLPPATRENGTRPSSIRVNEAPFSRAILALPDSPVTAKIEGNASFSTEKLKRLAPVLLGAAFFAWVLSIPTGDSELSGIFSFLKLGFSGVFGYILWRLSGFELSVQKSRLPALQWMNIGANPGGITFVNKRGEAAHFGDVPLCLNHVLEHQVVPLPTILPSIVTAAFPKLIEATAQAKEPHETTVWRELYQRIQTNQAETSQILSLLTETPKKSHLAPLYKLKERHPGTITSANAERAINVIEKYLAHRVGAVSVSTFSEQGSISVAPKGAELAIVPPPDGNDTQDP